jgi:hypothetical protein
MLLQQPWVLLLRSLLQVGASAEKFPSWNQAQ